MSRPLRPLARLAVATSLVLSPLALAACGDDDSEPEAVTAPAEETPDDDGGFDYTEGEPGVRYEGAYDSQFYGELDLYLGEEVVVSAGVEAVPGPAAFTIAGVADTGVEPLLVLAPGGTEGLEAGMEIEVTGTVQGSFSATAAEEDLGLDLDEEALAAFESEPYLVADTVDEVVDAG